VSPARHPKRAITRDIRTRHPKRRDRERRELEALGWPETAIRVRDVMSRAPVTVRWSATIGAAWKLMRSHRVRHLPVLDDADRLVGIVTDRDLRQVIFDPAIQEQLGSQPEALNVLAVREVMTWGVITIRPDAEIREAARLMHEQRIGALPVADQGRVLGILTERDVVKTFVQVLGEGVLSRAERWGLEA
jgi:acetoin utilization protein AcuB